MADSDRIMSSYSEGLPVPRTGMPEWWPVVVGLMALYVPTLYGLFQGLWGTEAQVHGPIILALALWLMHRRWPEMMEKTSSQDSSAIGWIVFAIALSLYLFGRSLQIYMFEVGSFIWMLAAILLVKRGIVALKVLWFPLFFMLFMVPLPGTWVIILTTPMKMAVSYVAEYILYFAGFPIGRDGVILQIGQYQFLVADACAGLQTVLTLEAMGLFYLNVVRYSSILRNVLLAILIIPISFVANTIRVITLVLITYYFGEDAGQGFLHWFAGIVLFLYALLLIMGTDALFRFLARLQAVSHEKAV
jgi:exosortase B